MKKIQRRNKRRFSPIEKARRCQILDDHGNHGAYPHHVIERFFFYCDPKAPHRKYINPLFAKLTVREFIDEYRIRSHGPAGVMKHLRWLERHDLIPKHNPHTIWRLDKDTVTILISSLTEDPKLGRRRGK